MAEEEATSFLKKISESKLYQLGTLVGLVVALVTAPLALPPVQQAIFEPKKSIGFRIVREDPAFDVRRGFEDISVIYKGQNLSDNGLALVVSRVSLVNDGGKPISPSEISPTDPPGIRITGGRVVGIWRAVASSDHLRRKAYPQVSRQGLVFPAEMVMEPRDSITIDLLVIKKISDVLVYRSVGKVEGVDTIGVSRSIRFKEPSVFWKAMSGTPWVQVVRLVAYSLFFLLIIAVFVGFAAQVSAYQQRSLKLKRKRICRRAREILANIDSDIWMLISAVYINKGSRGLRTIGAVVEKPDFPSKFDEEVKVLTSEPRKDAESVAEYLSRTAKAKLYGDSYAYHMAIALQNVGKDVKDVNVRSDIKRAALHFDRAIDEIAVEQSVSRSSLDNTYEEVVEDVFVEVSLNSNERRRLSRGGGQ